MRLAVRPILLALLLLAVAPFAALAEVKEGEVHATFDRQGTPLRDKPRAIAKLIKQLVYGTRVKVEELDGLYARVSVEGTKDAGWLRLGSLVPPATLTGPGAYGPASKEQIVAASTEITAAGRQFSAKIERTWRSMAGNLEDAYLKVDAIEAEQPSEADVLAFIREGHLGPREGATSSEEKPASVRLVGASGSSPHLLSAPVASGTYVPRSDVDFVERLGIGLSPEQEYYLGRAVAAQAISEHGLDPDAALQAHVRKIGAAMAFLSDRLPSMHGGWHFAVLASKEPNGVSGPGGFVFVSRGAIALARSEDEIASILAHEAAHVALRHGEAVIRRSRDFTDAMERLIARVRAPKEDVYDCNICQEMAELLGKASAKFARTLNAESYGSDLELQADWQGSLLLCEVGYRASALAEYLETLPGRDGARWADHPTSTQRIDALRPIVQRHGCDLSEDVGAQARMPRFKSLTTASAAAK